MKLVLATANPDKAVEIRSIIGASVYGLELAPRPAEVADVVEDGDTLEANARLKARAIADAAQLPALADDTGLEIDALGGAPGIHAARYAGEDATYADNVAKVLAEMESITDPAERRARFRTVVMVRWPDGREVVAEGVVEGHITAGPRGDGGFGYDPIFVPDDTAPRSFSELSDDEKNAISHRGRALRALAEALAD